MTDPSLNALPTLSSPGASPNDAPRESRPDDGELGIDMPERQKVECGLYKGGTYVHAVPFSLYDPCTITASYSSHNLRSS